MILGFIWTAGGIFCPLKQRPNLDTNSVSIRVLMKSASMYSFAKNELSISSKELIKNVLYSVENGVLKNFTNFIKLQTFSALQIYSKETSTHMFSYKICVIFKKNYLENICVRPAASLIWKHSIGVYHNVIFFFHFT